MLRPEIVLQVQRLIERGGLSQRQIARQLGVSRTTVGAIARGRRRVLPGKQSDRSADQPNAAPRRCPGCGGLVTPPCLLCRIRRQKQLDTEIARWRELPHAARRTTTQHLAPSPFTSQRTPNPLGHAPDRNQPRAPRDDRRSPRSSQS